MTALTPDQPWLSVAGVEVDANGLGRYDVRIDRGQLPETGSFTGRLAIVHGDVRNGNIIVGPQGLAAVLDWEVAKVGDPMEDLAWPCLRCWRFGEDALEVGGFGDRATLVDAYVEAGGSFDPVAFHWWKVLGTMRWGLGLAGQAAQHLSGAFSNIVMAGSGRRVAELEFDLLCLLEPDGTA